MRKRAPMVSFRVICRLFMSCKLLSVSNIMLKNWDLMTDKVQNLLEAGTVKPRKTFLRFYEKR